MGKCDFWDFKRLNFLWPKKVSFLSRTLLNIISSLTFTENNWKKNYIFWQKAWVNPFGKIRFLELWKITFFLWPKKVSFRSRTLLNIISSLILSENNSRQKYIFWPKAWVNPFGKMPFLGLWKIIFFYGQKRFLCVLEHY